MASETVTPLSPPIVLHFGPVLSRLSDLEFSEFCRVNPDWRIEQTQDGDLVIMPPTGGETGRRSLNLGAQLHIWSGREGTGVSFDSSTLFRLPSGAKRSPDASWVRRQRWEALSEEEREQFPPLAPDFVVELRSKTDSIEDLRAKMREYIQNGSQLGWLIDPYARRVEVYRPGHEPLILDNPPTLSADPELPGFVLDLEPIW